VQQTQALGHGSEEVADTPTLHKYAPKVAFQVFHEGQLVLHSANAGTEPMTTCTRGFDTVHLSDEAEREVFARRNDESEIQVYIGEQTETHNEILWAVMRDVLLPLAFTLSLLTLLLWCAVRRAQGADAVASTEPDLA
jgi:two-component system sensor histidine kinase QseC